MSNDIKKLIVHHLKQESQHYSKLSASSSDVCRKLCSVLQERNELYNSFFVSAFEKHLKAMIQDGPQCGLVALCMGYQYLFDEESNVEEVFKKAKQCGFTCQGEMFSCENMGKLWSELTNCASYIVENVRNQKDLLVQVLLAGNPVLVPYDRDHNNEPCLQNGLRAHWTLLTGIVLICEDLAKFENILKYCEADESMPNLYHVKAFQQYNCSSSLCQTKKSSALPENVSQNNVSNKHSVQCRSAGDSFNDRFLLSSELGACLCNEATNKSSSGSCMCRLLSNKMELIHFNKDILDCTIYVYAWQGRSLRVQLWSLDKLLDSNANLREVEPKVLKWENGIVDANSCLTGLCGKVIVLSRTSL